LRSAHGPEPLSCARDSAVRRPCHLRSARGLQGRAPMRSGPTRVRPTRPSRGSHRHSYKWTVGRSSRFRSPRGSAPLGSGRPHCRSRGRHHARATIAKRACARGQTSRGPDRLRPPQRCGVRTASWCLSLGLRRLGGCSLGLTLLVDVRLRLDPGRRVAPDPIARPRSLQREARPHGARPTPRPRSSTARALRTR